MARPKNKWTREFAGDLARKMLNWFQASDENWFLGEFAATQKMHRSRLAEIAAKFPHEFGETFQHCKQIQENKLLKFGIEGKKNPVMTIFALKNTSEWRDNPDGVVNNAKTINQYYMIGKKKVQF